MIGRPLQSVELKSVIIASVCEGEGTKADPCRLVTYVYDPSGFEIARRDPFAERREDINQATDEA